MGKALDRCLGDSYGNCCDADFVKFQCIMDVKRRFLVLASLILTLSLFLEFIRLQKYFSSGHLKTASSLATKTVRSFPFYFRIRKCKHLSQRKSSTKPCVLAVLKRLNIRELAINIIYDVFDLITTTKGRK